MPDCIMQPDEVNEAFIAGAPLIAKAFQNFSIQSPSFFADLYDVQVWPDGAGTMMIQPVFRGSLPAIEEGFDKWARQDNNTGCDPCAGPNCSYNWSQLGGHSLQRKVVTLMSRDYKSNNYCVKTIQTTFEYKQIMTQIVQNLYDQIKFVKEINIGQNFLTSIAKKYVIDMNGPQPNTADPYSYRPPGTATLGALTEGALQWFYEWMRLLPSAVPYDMIDGAPLYAMSASPELLATMYRLDPSLRQDARFSSRADELLSKYNFQSVVRGMFFQVPFLFPRRFKANADNTGWIRVLPFLNGIPGNVGTYSDINPQYIDANYATHEEVLLHGKYPFTVWYQPTVETIGENTSFGPEPGFFDNWLWVNPQTREDPGRREGFFWTHATIGISAQYSDAVFGLLVPRPPTSMLVSYFPTAVCPPAATTCTNTVPDVDCPCQVVLSVSVSPVDPTHYFVTFAAPVDAAEDDAVLIQTTGGGYITGTVITASADSTAFEMTFDVAPPTCLENLVGVFCVNNLACTADVLQYAINSADATRVDLILSNPIIAVTATNAVTLYYGNGTTQAATVISVNMSTNKWVVDIGGSNFADNVGGIKSICVPTATNAACPACPSGPTYVQCEVD